MTQTLIEKLEALPRFSTGRTSDEMVRIDDVRAIIEDAKAEKQETEAHNGYIEGTAERLRLICSKLGIGAPVSNEEIMFCQFSLLGAIRRKIDEIYTTPQPDIVAELVKALEDIMDSAKYFPSNAKRLGDIAESALAKAKEMMDE